MCRSKPSTFIMSGTEIIPFNKPFLTGKETAYIEEAVKAGHISGDGIFTKRCHNFFETHYGFRRVLLTTSCTDALEMAAILANITAGDEVIMPSFTFVSTANAFVLRGANIVFADSAHSHPCINADAIEALITLKTRAIVVVHYAGVACDMDKVMAIANRHNVIVIEDAAQAIDSYYTSSNGERRVLGSIGHLAAFSFHETKNIISGEGGMLVINDPSFIGRAEIIREKGTNRSAFFRGEVNKYEWVDIGSSFLPSDIIAAFLFAQLENIDRVQQQRLHIWNRYAEKLAEPAARGLFALPMIPDYASNNANMFYLLCNNEEQRNELIQRCLAASIHAVFHYLALHRSPFFSASGKTSTLPNAERYSKTLVRLPMYYELTDEQIDRVIDAIVVH
jgi:dTDP-4-amino-4,6-dideoxygalactose transaminase